MENFDFSKIRYSYRPIRKPKTIRNIKAIGVDSEADRDGKTFLWCLSTGESYTPDSFIPSLFDRKHRGKVYVVYNLKYEQGAILQSLPVQALNSLKLKGKCDYEGYSYKVVGYKHLTISRGKNAVQFWDMYPFYETSLAVAARAYTTIKKLDIDVTQFTPEYIADNLDTIKQYCVRDAKITEALFYHLIEQCNKLGIHPTTFYSIATIGYKYMRENTDYVTVKHLWDTDRDVLEAACKAYSGGKFEVTTRGRGVFYEYDINSAYPSEIANLRDISRIRIVRDREYHKDATYGFIYVDCWIPEKVSHPIAYKRKTVNIYPIGRLKRWITKREYEYLVTLPKVEIKILQAKWIYSKNKKHPYRAIINKLFKVKAASKLKNDTGMYRFTWRMTNSIYGKQIQLIARDGYLYASTCWNPVYGAIITANIRVRIAELQQKYSEIIAVHTDSVISTKKLPLEISPELGGWDLKIHGEGVMLGSGVYQIADKVRFRGFPVRVSLFKLLSRSPPIIEIPETRAITWRQVIANGWSPDLINRFVNIDKHLNINFDTKRLWLGSWGDGDDALSTVIESIPFMLM